METLPQRLRTGRELDWRERAACRGHDPEMFLPEGKFAVNSPEYKAFVGAAKAVCEHCEVRGQCYEFGLGERVGIFGGCTSSERAKARKLNRVKIINVILGER